MKRPNMLSATFVKTVKTPGRYGDGRGGLGLSLLVKDRRARPHHQMLDAERSDRPEAHQHRPRTLSGRHPRPGPTAGA